MCAAANPLHGRSKGHTQTEEHRKHACTQSAPGFAAATVLAAPPYVKGRL